MEQMRIDATNYVDNIHSELMKMHETISDLEKAHDDRVVMLKTQIASTMSEYDNLLRSRTELITDAQKQGDFNLVNRTQSFKKKIDNLEIAHNNLMYELAERRDLIIKQIQDEIDSLDASKPERLKSYEDEITSITSAYDAMLKDEQKKLDAINKHIKIASAEQEKFLSNMHNQHLTVSRNYDEERQRLIDLHNKNLEESSSDFKKISDDLKKEFDALLEKRNALSDKVTALVERYKKIDDEVAQDELELKYECNEKLFEARKLFENEHSKKKEELSILDILNDDFVDVLS